MCVWYTAGGLAEGPTPAASAALLRSGSTAGLSPRAKGELEADGRYTSELYVDSNRRKGARSSGTGQDSVK